MSQSIVFTVKRAYGFKLGAQAADHDGWILMNGRAVSTLTAKQRAKAIGKYGWTTNIPNMTNGEFIDNGGVFGAASGSDNVTLTQANLPNYAMTGDLAQVTNTHNHSLASNGSQQVMHPWGATINNSGNGNQFGARTIDVVAGGQHNHSFTINRTATAFSVENSYLSVNSFVYLG